MIKTNTSRLLCIITEMTAVPNILRQQRDNKNPHILAFKVI